MNELQSKYSDPEAERKLRNKVKKLKALLLDAQEELEHERETRSNSAALRSLRSQVRLHNVCVCVCVCVSECVYVFVCM